MDRNFGDRRKRSDANGRRLKRWLSSIALLVTLGLIIVPVLLAVHDEAFQLDGDVNASTTTSIGGQVQTIDWDSIFNGTGVNGTGKKVGSLPAGFGHATFSNDFGCGTSVPCASATVANATTFNTLDPTTYTTGSKDTLPITPGWQCTVSNNVNSKVDLMNAYAADYIDPVTKKRFLYFGMERNVNTGDANVGFWFLQGDANCASAGGTTAWTGHHHDGDLFIVSAFTKGGNVSTITAYRWTQPDPNNEASGFIDPTPVAAGADCRGSNVSAGDTICAAANSTSNGVNGTINIPWLTVNKTTVDNSLDHGEFFEGGINLTDTNFGDKCFNTFVGDTRSSQSLTATIFDYARGTLGECASTTTTNASISVSASIGTGSVSNVTDSATIHVDGISTFNGTVQFYLCGPSVGTIALPCGTGTLVNGTAGGTQGVPIGSAQTVTMNATIDTTQTPVTLTSVGNYCWGAIFSGDNVAGVPASQDDGTNECFAITKVTPTLTTQAGTNNPVDLGTAVTDTATLSGTATAPGTNGIGPGGTINATNGAASGGTITFTLRGLDNPTATPPVCSTTTVTNGTGTNPQDVTGIHGDFTYGPVSYTPGAPGNYHWVAIYTSNNINTNNSALHDSDCTDPNEAVIVKQIPSTIKTRQSWYPNDTALISAVGAGNNLGTNGTVRFRLYAGSVCTGTAFYDQTVTVTGGTPSETKSTTNTTVAITTLFNDPPGTQVSYAWLVEYAPNASDSAHLGIQSSCNTEHFTITYTNDNGPGTAFP